MKKLFLLACIIVQAVFGLAQQDPQYSQYMFNQMAINPAYAGSRDALSASAFLRDQWTGIEGAPKTETLTIHGPLKKKKVGLGLAVVADQIGPTKSIGIMGSYAYRLQLRKGKLSFGLRAGVYNFTYNLDPTAFKDQGDIYNMRGTMSKIVPTADAGLYYYTNTLYAGFSATHLYNGKLTSVSDLSGDNAELSPHYFFTFGKAWSISDKVVFNPSLLVKAAKGAPGDVDVNASFLLNQKIWVGASFRTSKSIVAYAQIYVSDKFKIGYAYDFGFSQIGRIGGGTHEIMLGYDFNIFKSKIASPRYL